MRALLFGIALLALPALTAPAAAQEVPDLSGFWAPTMTAPESDHGMLAKLPPGTVLLEDIGAFEYPPGEYGGLTLTPAARALAEAWKPQDEMTISRVCEPPAAIYSIQGPFPFEVYQSPELIVFKYEYYDQVRVVFMDGRAHPPADAPHTKTGHSIGHWEGDELVVDTTHLAASTITNNGLEHGDRAHMVERYKLSEDGRALLQTQWFEDPEMLENSGARFMRWERRPGEYVFPYECDPSFALEYQQMGEAAD